MKLRDKYKSLQDKNSIKKRIIESVYATMMLEGQHISKQRLGELYDEVNSN